MTSVEIQRNQPLKPYSTLLITSYCALHRKDGLCVLARWFCVSRKGGTGGGGRGGGGTGGSGIGGGGTGGGGTRGGGTGGGRTGGGRWGHLQDAVHMAAARPGCKMTMVGTGSA